MSWHLRVAGAGMAIGGILFFGRMAPIFAIMPNDFAFPPATTIDLVRLAGLAGPLWPLSHAMGLVAVLLFVIGYWSHARALASAGHKIIGTVAAIIATMAFSSFAIALSMDGFLLYDAATAYTADTANSPSLIDVGNIHAKALIFFTPAIFLMFIAMGVLSSRILHGFIHSRWLGGLGMMIAIAGPTAYLFGVTGPNWDNLQIGGSLMMLAFLWHFFTGLLALFGRGTKVKQATPKSL